MSCNGLDAATLEGIRSGTQQVFRCPVEITQDLSIPPTAYNSSRRQYLASTVLRAVRSMPATEYDRVVCLTDVDLYVPGLNFVFGQADLGGHAAVVSLHRLRQEYYDLQADTALFLERAVKEVVHELGHTFGLPHCPDLRCVMHFSNSLADTDRKEAHFCDRCRPRLLAGAWQDADQGG
ncbi:MAG: archaemetzincin family Zn-dependent metalloprotease [Chloroflexota bacterium]